MANKNTSEKMENIKSLFDSIKQSIMEKMDCESVVVDKNKVLNDLADCGLDLIKSKKLLNCILDCINKWKMENDNDLQFDLIYKLAHCVDYMQSAIDALNGFIEKNRQN